MPHKDKLRTSPANKAYTDGLKGIDWSVGREEREDERVARKKAQAAAAEKETMRGTQIIRDIEPFIDPIEGKVISGNRQKREFMRRHGVVDVGNERGQNKQHARPDLAPDIKRAYEELKDR